MFSLGSLGYMVGIIMVNAPFWNCGGIQRTWYLVGLVSLQSLIQILRAVTLTVHKVMNGVIRDGKVTFKKVRRASIQYRGLRRVIQRNFHNFSVVNLPLVKSIDCPSVIVLQSFQGILAQQFENLGWQTDRAIIPFEGLLGSWLLRMRPEQWLARASRPGRMRMPRGEGMDVIKLIRREVYTPLSESETKSKTSEGEST